MQVKDLTVDELKELIRETVAETLEEYIDDPDQSLEVKEEVKQRLLAIQKQRDAGRSAIPAAEAYKKLGLNRE